ncbi:hypothetical protein GGE46_004222 [Rhizobium etli]|uniref:Secreted protein n=1 Tax=Rhizobium etli TaxID=29449 RepID=A0A7W6VE51_RHIET|nr:hypothetical protein [Rhizobium etli]MBB4537453.1 hypothetical protein [Rhizobium etli]
MTTIFCSTVLSSAAASGVVAGALCAKDCETGRTAATAVQTNRTERQCRTIITYPLMMITGLAGRGASNARWAGWAIADKTAQKSAFFLPHKKHEKHCQHNRPIYVEYYFQVLMIFRDVAQLQRNPP